MSQGRIPASSDSPYIRDSLSTEDILGASPKTLIKTDVPAKQIIQVLEDKKSNPKQTKPRNYNENNSFDYSDVNFSR